MHLTNILPLLPFLALSAQAVPSLYARNNTSSSGSKSKSCHIASGGSNATDDSVAIRAAFAECAKDATIYFDEGVDYYAMTPIRADNLSNVDIMFQGNLHLPEDIPTVQAIVNQTNGLWLSGVWLTLAGKDVSWYGTTNVSSGWIYGYGQQWWDLNVQNNANGTGLAGRPHLANFNLTNGLVQSWKVRKPIAWNMQLSGDNITVRDTIIDAFTSGGFPFNTDGFDIGATRVVVDGFTIANGDDAVAIQTGARDVTVKNGFVSHHSHGMSIGSLGQNQAIFANVSNILFDNIVMDGAVYGARFKSWIGGQGLARNITWSNFRLNNVSFPIFVTQIYFNQGSAQTQIQSGNVTGRLDNSSVILEDFTWSNFTGSINTFDIGDRSCVSSPCWYDAGISTRPSPGTQSVILECNNATTCSGFKTENVQVFPQSLDEPEVVCINVGEEENPDLGFRCGGGNYNGTFVAV